MWKDPIVEEVRRAREELARRANYDLHTFFENLRKSERKRKAKVVPMIKGKTIASKSPEHVKQD